MAVVMRRTVIVRSNCFSSLCDSETVEEMLL